MEELNKSKFTVLFDVPFWVGIFERLEGDKLFVCEVAFGAEPTDTPIHDFLMCCDTIDG